MTPKEKAKELFFKYYEIIEHTRSTQYVLIAKKCALIAVDEILGFIEDDRQDFSWKKYYQEVKQEIEKL